MCAPPAPPTPPQRFRLTVLPLARSLDCAADQTLLLAALGQGLQLPHSCRNGSCRACLARLRSGEVVYRVEWPGLSREEKDAGWTLPCVALPRSDVCLEAPLAQSVLEPPAPAPARPPG